MANPQPEPFVQFSKELYRAILAAPFGSTQQAIVLAVILKTYGDFKKKAAPISMRLLAQLTGCDRGQVSRSLATLVEEGVITRSSVGLSNHAAQMLSVNKDYERWGRFSVPLQTDEVTSTVEVSTTVEPTTTQPLRSAQHNGCGQLNTTVEVSSPTEDSRHRDLKTTPPIVPPSREEEPAEEPPDPFDELWTLLPKQNGSKELSRFRFHDLSTDEQDRCLAAARHVREYLNAGGSVKYLPANENFIGGQKARYQMWVDGIPPRYRSDNGSTGARATTGVTDPDWQAQLEEAYSDG